MNFYLSYVVFATVLLMGCATHHTQDYQEDYQAKDYQDRSDLLERFNRSIFNFNYNVLDPYVVRKAAVVWQDYMPKLARNGLSNFFANLEDPATMVNYFIDGTPYKAMVHFNRFFLNTLLGMAGLVDVAVIANPKLAKEEPRRFGSTLGNYGVGYGPYVQLPGYGNFTLREDIGSLVDNFYTPLSCLKWWMSVSKWALTSLETRAHLLNSDYILRNSKDPYIMLRTAYFQLHDFLANDGVLTSQENNPNDAAIQEELNSIDAQ